MSYKFIGMKRGGGVLAVVVPMVFVWLISKIWRDAQ